MPLEDKDIPTIVDKGFELASTLLSPDTFYSLAVHQREKQYSDFIFDTQTGKAEVMAGSKKIEINPNKIFEQGVSICKKGDIFFKEGGKGGVSMAIKPEMCHPDEYIGSVHVHPGGSPIPSPGDLGASTHNKDQIMCIGSRLDTDKLVVNCYLPKTEWLLEEIEEVDKKTQNIMKELKEEQLYVKILDKIEVMTRDGGTMKLDNPQRVSIPIYNAQKVRWFSSTLYDTIRDYYKILQFTR
jgi:hypothetical protein